MIPANIYFTFKGNYFKISSPEVYLFSVSIEMKI